MESMTFLVYCGSYMFQLDVKWYARVLIMSLLSNENLCRKRMEVDSVCLVCEKEVCDDEGHVFVSCNFSTRFWRNLGIFPPTQFSWFGEFKALFFEMMWGDPVAMLGTVLQ